MSERRSFADAVRAELRKRGWKEHRQREERVVAQWRHEDGQMASSLHDAFVKQLMREVRS